MCAVKINVVMLSELLNVFKREHDRGTHIYSRSLCRRGVHPFYYATCVTNSTPAYPPRGESFVRTSIARKEDGFLSNVQSSCRSDHSASGFLGLCVLRYVELEYPHKHDQPFPGHIHCRNCSTSRICHEQ